MRRLVHPPPGTWPPRMQAELAAAYCGEKHVEDFLERVGRQYPQPRHRDTSRRRFWYREDLDRAIGTTEPEGQSLGAKFREKREERRG